MGSMTQRLRSLLDNDNTKTIGAVVGAYALLAHRGPARPSGDGPFDKIVSTLYTVSTGTPGAVLVLLGPLLHRQPVPRAVA